MGFVFTKVKGIPRTALLFYYLFIVAMDIQSKLEIISFLKEWSKEKVIIASHDMEEGDEVKFIVNC